MSSEKLEKLVVVGELGTGKTSMINRLIKGYMPTEERPTLGSAYVDHPIEVSPTEKRKFRIWDTSGEERFHSMFPAYYRDAKSAIVVFDTSDHKSFENLEFWINMTRVQGGPAFPFILVGTKTDLRANVTREEAQQIATKEGCPLLYCSAQTGNGIEEVFKQAVKAEPVKFYNPALPTQTQDQYTEPEPKETPSMLDYKTLIGDGSIVKIEPNTPSNDGDDKPKSEPCSC